MIEGNSTDQVIVDELVVDAPQIEEVVETSPIVVKPGRLTAIGITRTDKEESKHKKKIAKASRKKTKQMGHQKRKFSKRPNKKKQHV